MSSNKAIEIRKGIASTIKKGEMLQMAGDKPMKAYHVKKGLLRSYIIDEKGKEHIFMFAPEGWIVGDMDAASQNAPSKLFIDALEDTELVIIEQRLDDFTLEELQNNVMKIIRRAGVLQNRVLMLMSSSAEERYQHFIDVYPQLLNRVPQKMIASYLGITPQALSRIRAEMAKSGK